MTLLTFAMETAKYTRISDLPEPDYFEIELEKIYCPPLTRTERLKKWARRNILLVACVTFSILAVILYIAISTMGRPIVTGILRAEVVPAAKQVDLTGASEGQAQVSVSGSEIVNADEDDILIDADTAADDANLEVNFSNGTTTVSIDEPAGNGQNPTGQDISFQLPAQNGIDSGANPQKGGNDKPTVGVTPIVATPANQTDAIATDGNDDDNAIVEPNPDKNVMLEKPDVNNTESAPLVPLPPKPTPPNSPPAIPAAAPPDNEPLVPIMATFYSSVEGPKSCRGHVLASLRMPKPAQPGIPTPSQCYNFPNLAASGCATFLGNKVDGCVADVFGEPNCKTYMNTAAFMVENRPVGGNWRSVRVQCGLPEPDPESLGKPPMADKISSLVDNDHPS